MEYNGEEAPHEYYENLPINVNEENGCNECEKQLVMHDFNKKIYKNEKILIIYSFISLQFVIQSKFWACRIFLAPFWDVQNKCHEYIPPLC